MQIPGMIQVPTFLWMIPLLTWPPRLVRSGPQGPLRTPGLHLLMATWVREYLADLQPGLSVARTAKFSVLNVDGIKAAKMADAADVVMSEAPKAVPDTKPSKKGGGKQKGGAAPSGTAEAPAKKGGWGYH